MKPRKAARRGGCPLPGAVEFWKTQTAGRVTSGAAHRGCREGSPGDQEPGEGGAHTAPVTMLPGADVRQRSSVAGSTNRWVLLLVKFTSRKLRKMLNFYQDFGPFQYMNSSKL